MQSKKFPKILIATLGIFIYIPVFGGTQQNDAVQKFSENARDPVNACQAQDDGEEKWTKRQRIDEDFFVGRLKTMAEEEKTRLNDYFYKHEFDCKCGEDHESNMDELFIERLTEMRAKASYKWTITSGFRCVEYNKTVAGGAASLHLAGRAADIFCVDNKCRMEIIRLALMNGMNGIGIGSNFVHVDDRKAERASCWTYYK